MLTDSVQGADRDHKHYIGALLGFGRSLILIRLQSLEWQGRTNKRILNTYSSGILVKCSSIKKQSNERAQSMWQFICEFLPPFVAYVHATIETLDESWRSVNCSLFVYLPSTLSISLSLSFSRIPFAQVNYFICYNVCCQSYGESKSTLVDMCAFPIWWHETLIRSQARKELFKWLDGNALNFVQMNVSTIFSMSHTTAMTHLSK